MGFYFDWMSSNAYFFQCVAYYETVMDLTGFKMLLCRGIWVHTGTLLSKDDQVQWNSLGFVLHVNCTVKCNTVCIQCFVICVVEFTTQGNHLNQQYRYCYNTVLPPPPLPLPPPPATTRSSSIIIYHRCPLCSICSATTTLPQKSPMAFSSVMGKSMCAGQYHW